MGQEPDYKQKLKADFSEFDWTKYEGIDPMKNGQKPGTDTVRFV